MTLPRLDRRQALKSAGLLGTAALAALIPAGVAAGDQPDGEAGVQGTWLVEVVQDVGGAKTHVLITYAQGGTITASGDNSPGTLYGAWSHTSAKQAGFTFEGFQFAANGGALTGILRVRGLVSHDEETDTISGPAHLDFQPHGIPAFVDVGPTHFAGSRIRVLPL